MSDLRFLDHTDPVWRDRANFIIHAPLESDGIHSEQFEQLWVRRIAESEFEICCIPFFLYGFALGDTVRTSTLGEMQFVVDALLSRSGHFVLRVHFSGMEGSRDSVVKQLNDMGALLEWWSPTLVAVDARDADHAQEFVNFLVEEQRQGRIVYETGWA